MVSIIIPVYNVAPYIEDCLKSVMRQTYAGAMECIIVDDCGPDDSIVIVERMIGLYDGPIRFKILHHTENRGLSAARNTGTAAATGEYIFYFDSDDIITDDCIEMLMTPVIRDSTIDIVMGRSKRVPANYSLAQAPSRELVCQEFRSSEAVRDFFFGRERILLPVWNNLIKKDFISGFGLSFKEGIIWEDLLWSFFVMKHLGHLFVIKDVTYFYYIRPNSICTGTDIKIKRYYWGVVFNEISNNFTPGESDREARFYFRFFCRHYIYCSNHDLYKNTARNFRRELSVMHDPFECLLLFCIDVLSKTCVGRVGLQGMVKVFHAIRRLRS